MRIKGEAKHRAVKILIVLILDNLRYVKRQILKPRRIQNNKMGEIISLESERLKRQITETKNMAPIQLEDLSVEEQEHLGRDILLRLARAGF